MIRVTVDLVPGGWGDPITLSTVLIDNRSHLAPISDYRVRIVGKDGRMLRKRESMVRGHARKSKPVLTLIRRALQEAGY